jgi:hypothetical protein
MKLIGPAAASIIVISASLLNAQDVVSAFRSQAMQMAAERCADWRSRTVAGRAANANESVQPSEWAACVDAQTESTLGKFRGRIGVDPKFETLRNRDNCSERRFGWQPVFSKWSSALR